jgi:energy-coupling factor transporter ATP-binding protein EcfA2
MKAIPAVKKKPGYALLGPNSAGKTTTLKMVVGLLRPDSGAISVLGIDALADPVAAKQIMAWISDEPARLSIRVPHRGANGKRASGRARRARKVPEVYAVHCPKMISLAAPMRPRRGPSRSLIQLRRGDTLWCRGCAGFDKGSGPGVQVLGFRSWGSSPGVQVGETATLHWARWAAQAKAIADEHGAWLLQRRRRKHFTSTGRRTRQGHPATKLVQRAPSFPNPRPGG